jgi:AcrR family transcriptional regulator
MAPRNYKLGRRAETANATRQRILDAALELYRDVGVSATTLTAIGDRADVARGTILHHYGSADGLLGEAVKVLLEQQQLPDERIFEGLTTRDDRVRAYVLAMIGFQERSRPWWQVFESEMQRPELQTVEADYWAVMGRVQAAALGPELAMDARANAALMSLVHPATVGTFVWSFEQSGLEKHEARPFIAEVAVSMLRRIAEEKGGSG